MAEPLPGAPSTQLVAWGIDHHRTPVEIRERLACTGDEAQVLARRLCALPGVAEAVVLSTCNRLECYLGGAAEDAVITSAICELRGIDPQLLAGRIYVRRADEGVRHLFRVAGGLESLVVGEDQVVHQVKDAYEAARAASLAGPVLHPLFQRALSIAKEVRTQTAVGRHKLSVASVAVDLARHVHGDLASARLLLIGAGETAELTVKYLREQGVRAIGVINRSQERAARLAEIAEARMFPWSELVAAIACHDIVVSSTSARGVVVWALVVRAAQRLRRGRAALLFVDLAVPRDIDPAVGALADAYLYNIDHLESVVAANRELRQEEVAAAAALVDTAVAAHREAVAGSAQNELLSRIAAYFQEVVATEEARLAGKLGIGADDQRRRADLRYGLERVAGKLSHQPLAYLRAHPGDPAAEAQVRALLGLGGENADPTRLPRQA